MPPHDMGRRYSARRRVEVVKGSVRIYSVHLTRLWHQTRAAAPLPHAGVSASHGWPFAEESQERAPSLRRLLPVPYLKLQTRQVDSVDAGRASNHLRPTSHRAAMHTGHITDLAPFGSILADMAGVH